jgi:hypothetical protein
MKALTRIPLLFVLLSASVLAVGAQDWKPGEIKVDYDRFEDLTTIRIRPMPLDPSITDGISISALFAFNGQTPPRREPITLQIISASDQWRYLYNRELILLVDGERMPMGMLARDFAVEQSGMFLESMSKIIPYDIFLRIANAKKVEGRIGRKEFEMTPDYLKAFRDLASRMRQ